MKEGTATRALRSLASLASLASPSSLASIALAAAALALAGCSSALPAAAPHVLVAPPPPQAVAAACWIEFADGEAPGALGLDGTPDFEPWLVTFSGLLVRHPAGDVLVDAGTSAHWDDLVKTTRLVPRLYLHALVAPAEHVRSAPAALARAGEKVEDVHAVVLSHVHSDHAGGVVELPETRVYLGAGDLALAKAEKDDGGFDVIAAIAESLAPRATGVSFAPVPYENFDRSFDVYGDGTIVLVPLPGHTPGSLGTFVNLPGLRIFHVGDATNTFEAVLKKRGKSLPLSFSDRDGHLGRTGDEGTAAITLARSARASIEVASQMAGLDELIEQAKSTIAAEPGPAGDGEAEASEISEPIRVRRVGRTAYFEGTIGDKAIPAAFGWRSPVVAGSWARVEPWEILGVGLVVALGLAGVVSRPFKPHGWLGKTGLAAASAVLLALEPFGLAALVGAFFLGRSHDPGSRGS